MIPSYLALLILAGTIPFGLFLLIDRSVFFSNPGIFLKTVIGSLFFAYPLELTAIKNHIWYYPKPLIGIEFLGLPLEEYLFIIITAMLLTFLTLFLMKRYAR